MKTLQDLLLSTGRISWHDAAWEIERRRRQAANIRKRTNVASKEQWRDLRERTIKRLKLMRD